MFRKIKIPLIATFIIFAMFIMQGIHLLRLSAKDEQNKDLIELMKASVDIESNFNNINFKSNLVYEYAILASNGDILVSKLSKSPPNFDFQVLEYKGYMYYKNFFFYEDELIYIIVAKKISYGKLIFIAGLMLTSTIIVLGTILYFSYLSVIKPHLEQRKMMNTFFNDAMHELKTPLGVATINLEMLDIRNKHTHRIKSALKQMKVTYEDVEYFIKNSHVIFPKQVIDLSAFLASRIRFSSTIAHSKKIEITSIIDHNIKVYISEVEATRLIDNTISNAIKYSKDSSKIIISLKNEDNVYAVFSVQDFGYGIKDIKTIWDRYTRENFSQGGFGLGLNIVLNICHKYQILYNVKSIYGEGSIFTYKIPLYKDKILDRIS